MINMRYIPVLLFICVLLMKPVFVYGAKNGESTAPLETELIAKAQRLFDAPQVATQIEDRRNTITTDVANNVAPVELVFYFNGVISHDGNARVWVNNLPLALLQTTLTARQVRWNNNKSVLEVTLNSGKKISLLPGQALFSAADGSSFVRDEIK